MKWCLALIRSALCHRFGLYSAFRVSSYSAVADWISALVNRVISQVLNKCISDLLCEPSLTLEQVRVFKCMILNASCSQLIVSEELGISSLAFCSSSSCKPCATWTTWRALVRSGRTIFTNWITRAFLVHLSFRHLESYYSVIVYINPLDN